jgi:hypothetical protein
LVKPAFGKINFSGKVKRGTWRVLFYRRAESVPFNEVGWLIANRKPYSRQFFQVRFRHLSLWSYICLSAAKIGTFAHVFLKIEKNYIFTPNFLKFENNKLKNLVKFQKEMTASRGQKIF